MHTHTDIKYLSYLIHQSFAIPVRFVSEDCKILFEYSSIDIHNPFYPCKETYLSELYQQNDPDNFPIIRTNPYREQFILIHMIDYVYGKGTLIIGPSTYSHLSRDTIIKLTKEFHPSIKIEDKIAYFQSIPIIKKLTLIDIGILFHYLIFKQKLDISNIWEQNRLLNETAYPSPNPDLYISSRRQNCLNLYDVTLEKQLFTAIKEGNKEKVLEHIYASSQDETITLSKVSKLRDKKNHGIVMMTLAAQYAIEGNLPSEIAFSLSTLYIQILDQLDNIESVSQLIEEALCKFADRVKEYNNHQYSKTIVTCLDYISKNIYNKINLNTIAKSIKLNASYLSNIFKKEVGISLSEYIQKERVEEAKKLLTLTTYTLVDICTWLNFNDQSYFTKVFKKFTNMTPKQYREKYTVL
ncbi:AraC family transcriptional regulator [Bacillus thuringiensis serovar pingluonsis]|uniref:AraC family transcriptional regulator n=1 Tax=Bacillus thuringiensis serovar pingluonsis TaxID=180881 RepID=A0A243BIH3_BACTU|nr:MULTISPECIES: helix-turn-helix domain-containing protein [Bacillus cereus group]MEB9686072.1 helix-turn-helix domain-containing protein [Bacillus anthracis]OTY46722.1 AraC family transcriptional regulator [Bacillus thuringiensis serovar pingluonsis]